MKRIAWTAAAAALLWTASASAQISPTLNSQVKQLIKYAKNDFKAIRIDTTQKDSGGDYNYKVKAFNACGKKSEYNKVWWWRTMKGNWEYVCDVDFPDEYAATKYYDEMSAALKSVRSFKWDKEKVVNATTRRRLVGFHKNPKYKIMFDYDVADDGSVEIEFWFKQKKSPGAVVGAKAGGGKTGSAGPSVVSPILESQFKQLIAFSKSDFAAIRIDSTKADSGGDWNYRVKSFNACGKSSTYNKIWWWRSMKGNWEYVCDVDFKNDVAANAYYDEMKQRLTAIKGWDWKPERKVNGTTLRRLEGFMGSPRLKVMLDFDKADDGSVEIEFWFKQKKSPGAVTTKAAPAVKGGTSAAGGAISKTLAAQVRQLLKYAASDFSAIRIDSSKRNQGGDDTYKVKSSFNACGSGSVYNKIWHWKSMKGNWEYVCDVDFTNRTDGDAYFNAMKAVLTAMPEFEWKAERQVDGTTQRRLEGFRTSPPIKIMFDYDVESSGSVEIEFWFKQKFNK
ncbi:MAG: hypothetical protein ACI9WU_000584 [Myxococcota bacterium]|jgi:uncharacterized protein YxeA